MLWVRIASLCFAVATGCLGCSRMPSTQTLTVSGVTYTFPREHVEAYAPPEQGRAYVRLLPAGSNYLLIYSLDAFKPNRQGPEIPTIPTINFAPGKIQVSKVYDSLVVCTPEKRRYNCGIQLKDAGVVWSMLFDELDISRVNLLRQEAVKALESYRGLHALHRVPGT